MKFGTFIMRRLHSFLGVALVIFLIEHLQTNALAVLTPKGQGFISAVNFLHSIPFLGLVEILTLGLPFLIHIFWGFYYLVHVRYNVLPGNKKSPRLSRFVDNWLFYFQRGTALLLIIGVIWHVYDMRFSKYPVKSNGQFFVRVDKSLADIHQGQVISPTVLRGDITKATGKSTWQKELQARPLSNNQVIIETPTSGEAVLWNVWQTMRFPFMAGMYTVFVVLAVFHAFHGLYTAAVKWGLFVTNRRLRIWRAVTLCLMLVVGCLGLIAVWGMYA
jgi:succinate dehydrogenase / fumarate reductase cytochrome b subunit